EVLAGVVRAEADVGVGGQVEDEVVADHGRLQVEQVDHVAFDQAERRATADLRQEGPLAGGEVVVARDLVPVGQQPVDQVAADKPGGASDEDLHGKAPHGNTGESVGPSGQRLSSTRSSRTRAWPQTWTRKSSSSRSSASVNVSRWAE